MLQGSDKQPGAESINEGIAAHDGASSDMQHFLDVATLPAPLHAMFPELL